MLRRTLLACTLALAALGPAAAQSADGRSGWPGGSKGRSRLWAHFGLAPAAQAVLPWTWHSHHGGEEQALFGLVDHDDRPSWKLAGLLSGKRWTGTLRLEPLGVELLQR
jgi:beta-galactosidase